MNNKKWLDKISPLITANAQPASVSPESREQVLTEPAPRKSIGGRPSIKTPELLAEICRRVEAGKLISFICQDDEMPNQETIYDWIKKDAEFSKMLSASRRIQAGILAEEVVGLADNCEETMGAVGKTRLRMQGRQWLAGKWDSRFADKERGDIHVNTAVNVAVMSMERQRELQDRLAKALEGAQQ